ncbi:MAG: hypothetical protein OEY77_02875 [Nitrospira sp.]|nr:hypothetical protein [Nitrospira sp.]
MTAPAIPQAVQSCHELVLWLIPQLDKFPRMRRFTLGERIEMGRAGSGSPSVHPSTGSGRTDLLLKTLRFSVRAELVEARVSSFPARPVR